MATMTQKKSKPDQHKQKPLIARLAPEYHEQLKKSAKKNRRSMTEQLRIALEEFLAKESLWPPEGKTDG